MNLEERVIDEQLERERNVARKFLPKEIKISKELLSKVMNRQLSTKALQSEAAFMQKLVR